MSPAHISLQLIEDRWAFLPITGKPYHDNIVRIWEALTPLLLQAGYNKVQNKNNLWVIIAPGSAYAVKYDEPFTTPTRIGAYHPPHRMPSTRPENYRPSRRSVLRIAPYTTQVSAPAPTSPLPLLMTYGSTSYVTPPHFIPTFFPPLSSKMFNERCTVFHAINTVDPPFIIQGYYSDASSMPV